ncbi:Lysosome-associated membrane glycoprotein 5, partial [Lamprotornis superbus]
DAPSRQSSLLQRARGWRGIVRVSGRGLGLPALSPAVPADAAARLAAEQEVENLSGLSPNPEKDIFVVRENRTTCLMAEFAAKFIVPYDVWASNYVDLITEQADIPLSRGAEMKGKCGTNESELELSWLDQAYTLKLSFLKVRAPRTPGAGAGARRLRGVLTGPEGHNTSRGPEASWRLSRIQFTYDSSERTYFKDAVSPGKYTASSHRLSALVTPAGRSYECQAQQTISLVSSDHQKNVQLLLSEVRLQPFDIPADFVFSEEHKCPVDQREQLEETLPLILGLILGLVIVITLGIYHIHHKLTASQAVLARGLWEGWEKLHPTGAILVTQRSFPPGWLPPLEEGKRGASYGAAEGSRAWGLAELLSVSAGEAVAGDTIPRLLWEVAVPCPVNMQSHPTNNTKLYCSSQLLHQHSKRSRQQHDFSSMAIAWQHVPSYLIPSHGSA